MSRLTATPSAAWRATPTSSPTVYVFEFYSPLDLAEDIEESIGWWNGRENIVTDREYIGERPG